MLTTSTSTSERVASGSESIARIVLRTFAGWSTGSDQLPTIPPRAKTTRVSPTAAFQRPRELSVVTTLVAAGAPFSTRDTSTSNREPWTAVTLPTNTSSALNHALHTLAGGSRLSADAPKLAAARKAAARKERRREAMLLRGLAARRGAARLLREQALEQRHELVLHERRVDLVDREVADLRLDAAARGDVADRDLDHLRAMVRLELEVRAALRVDHRLRALVGEIDVDADRGFLRHRARVEALERQLDDVEVVF